MYTLMHKNIPAADITIDSAIGGISKIDAVHNPEHLPVGTTIPYGKDFGKPRRDLLNGWWSERSIPASRDGIREALDALGVCSPKLLLEKCYGLSLSDQYWIRPKHSDLTWEDVNFFTNDFAPDVGEILFGRTPQGNGEINFMSPDSTSDGWLKKKWMIADGKRVLMKGGSGVYRQEPFNEVVASVIMMRLGVPHVDYCLRMEGKKPYCVCENFVTPNTELVPAWRVKEARRKEDRDSVFAHLARVCEELEIPGFEAAMNRMLTVDFIISNEDRHFNNFGFIRDADTLRWIGAAPVYDSGTSLWYETNAVGQQTECKPFRSAHSEQLKLVQDLSWFDADALDGIGGEIVSILSESPDASPERAGAIAKAVGQRIARVANRSLEKPSLLAAMEIKQSGVKRRESIDEAVSHRRKASKKGREIED